MRVEVMANDSRSKSPRTLNEYACTISYHIISYLKIYELLLLWRNTLLEVLPDRAVGYVNQSLRNIICCEKFNCRKVQSKG